MKEQQEVPATGSLGLTYSVNEDGTTCTVTGIGTCTDSEIIIPKKSPEGYRVTKIGNNAFADSSATSITIPDTVTEIGTRAFYNCTGITEIHIPASVTKIGTQIFYKASALNTVYYDSTYSDIDNRFLSVANIKKVVFGGEIVPRYILNECTNITDIEILDSVTSIRFRAFYGCSKLTSVVIPDSVTSIGGSAFSGCSGLTSIAIPNSVTSIGSYAFSGCSGLTSVTIGNSVTSIGEYAFSDCSKLKEIHYNGTIEQWKAIQKGFAWDVGTRDYTVYCTDGNI